MAWIIPNDEKTRKRIAEEEKELRDGWGNVPIVDAKDDNDPNNISKPFTLPKDSPLRSKVHRY